MPDRALPREGRQGVDPIPAASAPADGVLRRPTAELGRGRACPVTPGNVPLSEVGMSRFAGDKMSHGIRTVAKRPSRTSKTQVARRSPSRRRSRCLMPSSPARNGKSSDRIRSRPSGSSSPLLAKAIVGSCFRVRSGSARPSSPRRIIEGALAKGNSVIFTAPILTLIDQTVAAFEAEGLHGIGVMQANHPRTDPLARVQVASVQTLARRGVPHAALVIVDEAHIRLGSDREPDGGAAGRVLHRALGHALGQGHGPRLAGPGGPLHRSGA